MMTKTIFTATLAVAVATSMVACSATDDLEVDADECQVDADCLDGLECVLDESNQQRACSTDDSCGPDSEWVYLAVVARSSSDAELLNTDSPGPDIDAIQLASQGVLTFATGVVVSHQGEPVAGNENTDVTALLGPNDATPDNGGGGECRLDESLYWSMGDNTGFVVVRFDERALADGDSILFFEPTDGICANTDRRQIGSFDVYVGRQSANLDEIDDASDFPSNEWLVIGEAPGSGGLTEYTVDVPPCR